MDIKRIKFKYVIVLQAIILFVHISCQTISKDNNNNLITNDAFVIDGM